MFSKITLPLKSSREIFWPGSRRLGRLKPGTCSGWVNPEAGTSIRKHSSRIENRDDGDKGLCVPVSSLVDNSHSGYPPPLHSCRYMISTAARYRNSNPWCQSTLAMTLHLSGNGTSSANHSDRITLPSGLPDQQPNVQVRPKTYHSHFLPCAEGNP